MAKQARFNEADGMAALGICESLLIALTELKIISEKNTRSLLTDVATKHNEAAFAAQAPERHQAVVEIVKRILAGKNGVRHQRAGGGRGARNRAVLIHTIRRCYPRLHSPCAGKQKGPQRTAGLHQ
jgi:hypothetical protein